MPSKRFFYTAAPLAIIALTGVGLAAAQSSSPFASKKTTQAWETPAQQPASPAPAYNPAPAFNPQPQYAAPNVAPAAYTAPRRISAPQYTLPPVPASADAPIATAPRRAAPAYATASTKNPPKTFGGQSAAPYQPPAAKAYAPPQAQIGSGSALPPAGSNYVYTPPPAPIQSQQTAGQPTYVAQAPNFGSPTPPTGSSAPIAAPSSGSPYAPRRAGAQAQTSVPQQYWTPPSSTSSTTTQQTWGEYERTRMPQAKFQAQSQVQSNAGSPYAPNGYRPAGPQSGYQSPTPPTGLPPTGAPYPGGPYTPAPQQPRSWKDKLGLGNIATLLRGAFTVGAAATNRTQPDNQFGPDDGWSEDFIGDADLEFEASAITQGGLEYGINLGGRAQYDPYRRGFGGRLPDCPPTETGCSGNTAALTSGRRGHASGFYSGGEDIAKDAQFALESAHVFLRSAYGDVTLGRDDGAAYLFSLGAPTLLAVGASNSPVDYTGYDSVKTVNDASGFSEKITYTSPRLLGDQIGVGVQFGASYALDADVCGVDYCNGKTINGIIQPEIEDVVELGVALDRTFTNGLSVELTGTYARGAESSGLDGLDDLESFGTGLEFGYGDFTLGGSYLQSNNGLLDGDYTAYDAGLTWQPGALGFTLGYGHAEDDNVGLKSDQATFGVTYDFDKFTVGTGVQYVDRDVNGLQLGIPTTLNQKATSVFVQGGFKF
jgi:hypothetical protein